MSTAPKKLIADVRRLLDTLVASSCLSSDEQEAIGDEVMAEARQLPRDGLLDALDKAIGSNKRRREVAVFLLSQWTDVPEVVERIGDWMHDKDPNWRSWLIQVVGMRRLPGFGPHLYYIIQHDPDEFCRDCAIHAAGRLRDEQCLPLILQIAEENNLKLVWRLAETLKSYATEECRPYLESWFNDNQQRAATRVMSAWGLAKLDDGAATSYLIEMLDDPDERGENYSRFGQSLRAAQALCDVFNWPFEWHKSSVAATKERVNTLRF